MCRSDAIWIFNVPASLGHRARAPARRPVHVGLLHVRGPWPLWLALGARRLPSGHVIVAPSRARRILRIYAYLLDVAVGRPAAQLDEAALIFECEVPERVVGFPPRLVLELPKASSCVVFACLRLRHRPLRRHPFGRSKLVQLALVDLMGASALANAPPPVLELRGLTEG